LLIPACGNWSNDDLEFLNAMPDKESLRAKIPTGTTGGLSGEGTRRDALAIGERSKLYSDTRGASDQFNGLLNFLLRALDFVRTLPPTTRTSDSRTWGPWDDSENPGFQFRVVIKKASDTQFVYAFQHRLKGGEFFDTVTGEFRPTPTLRKGKGGLTIHGAGATQLKDGKLFDTIEKIEMAYVTDQLPVTVVMKMTARPGQPLTTLEYGYQENADQSGGIGFRTIGTDPNVIQLDTGTAWLSSGAGYGVATVIEGTYRGATHFECWDASFNTSYVKQTWPGGVELGDPATCVTVSGFPRP